MSLFSARSTCTFVSNAHCESKSGFTVRMLRDGVTPGGRLLSSPGNAGAPACVGVTAAVSSLGEPFCSNASS